MDILPKSWIGSRKGALVNEVSLKRKRFWFTWIFVFVVFSLIIAFCIYWVTSLRYIKRTSDAYVQGNQVLITPLVNGFITEIYTDDTFLVEKGQLLIQLDPTDSKLAYEDAKQNFSMVIREVCATYHQVFAYQAEIHIREAECVKAEEFYNHRREVLNQGAISLEDFQTAEADLEATYFAWSNAKSLYEKEVSFIIGRSIRDNPLVIAAEDRLSQAAINLYRTKIFAPVRGLVAQRDAQLGMWVSSGAPLLRVIPLDQIWVNVNYKETQMKNMKIGQKVELKADMYGSGILYKGTIVGLPGGAGNAFSILPPQNLSGNWIKIVQRLPVRVALEDDDLVSHPLRIGMTMRSKVDVRKQSGSYLPKSSQGAPIYKTSIYENEIEKSKKQTLNLFLENADPSLEAYFFSPYFPDTN